MALIDKKADRERIEIPHEPGEWVELTRVTFGIKRGLAPLEGVDRVTYLVRNMVVAWSYPVPFTPENLDILDGVTSDWLAETVAERANRDPKAKPSATPTEGQS